MLDLFNPGTPVPKTRGFVAGRKFWRKNALGALIWNGIRGPGCKTYMITQDRLIDDTSIKVVRFPGCTEVPPPFSNLVGHVQTLVSMQQYFGSDVVITDTVINPASWIPLFHHWAPSVKIYKTPDNIGSNAPSQGALVDYGTVSHHVKNCEVHGALITAQRFIDQFLHMLVEVWLDENGKVRNEFNMPFNNIGIIEVLRGMLTLLMSPAKELPELDEYGQKNYPNDDIYSDDRIIELVDPVWENDDYKPCHDV